MLTLYYRPLDDRLRVAFLRGQMPSTRNKCYRAPPRQTLQLPLPVKIADELHRARNVRSLRGPIGPIRLGALIVAATLAAGLLLGGLWSLAAALPIALDAPYYVI